MDPTTVIAITFVAYMILLLGIGFWGDRRYGGSYEGFVTADKSLGGWVAAVSSAASSESAWVMLGLSGLGYAKGVAAYWAAIGCTLGFLATSLFVVVQLRRASEGIQVLTLGDYLAKVLGDRLHLVRVVSALIIALFMEVYVVAQFVGTGKQMAGMELMSYEGGVAAGAVLIGLYVLLGGYAAVCWTDLIQGMLMAAVMVVFPIMAVTEAGGVGAVLQRLGELNLASLWAGGEGLTWAALGFTVGQLGIGIGYPGMPHAVIRFITLKDEEAARDAAVINVAWGAVVLFGSVTLGVAGRVLIPELDDPEHILPAFTAAHLNPVLSGITLAAVSAAIMSTADSQLMMAATAAIHDLVFPVRHRLPAAGKARMRLTRVIIALLAAAALALALRESQVIFTFVLFAWGALGSSFTPVLLLSLYWRKLSWQGALASFIAGPLTVVIWKLVPGLSETLYELIPGAVVGTLAAVVVSWLTGASSGRPSATAG